MPQLSRFYGIISMFYDDHNPPHFHANYSDFSAQIGIHDLTILQGELPPRVLGLVIEWALLHRKELEENWNRMVENLPLNKIAPLT